MIRRGRRAFLGGQIAAVEEVLRGLPEDAILERLGFESRLADLREAIAAEVDLSGNLAHARLVFGGGPVAASEGIEARFAADALAAYQDLVSKALAAQVGLGLSGPIPFERQSRLHITDIVRGSFGFELDEVQDQDSFMPTPLKEAVEQSAVLIAAAARSDDEFVDVIAEVNPRVREALRVFFETLYKARATVGVSTWQGNIEFDLAMLEQANERVSIEWREEAEVVVEGNFKGVLHVSRAFEHQTFGGDVVKGKVDHSVELGGLNAWTLRQCAVRLKRLSWQRAGKQFVRYTLLGIDDLPGIGPG